MYVYEGVHQWLRIVQLYDVNALVLWMIDKPYPCSICVGNEGFDE
tara:strand:+ start:2719 stop:2853 length:135 start_codon:yes stop_codon:yes gene_type:complete